METLSDWLQWNNHAPLDVIYGRWRSLLWWALRNDRVGHAIQNFARLILTVLAMRKQNGMYD